MKLFHQTKADEWTNVIEDIAEELRRYRFAATEGE
jgi:virulence-associated protein VapD